MTLTIRANEGDWGGAQLSDVEAVARSAAASFAAFDDDESVAITLQPTMGAEDNPIALTYTNPSDEFIVRLNVRGTLWARLAYQFAHEFCHVVADPRTWTGEGDAFAWIEEALCETASLVALRSMARSWATDPPYPHWHNYSSSLADYEAEQTSGPARSLPPGMPFSIWFADRLPLLESNPFRRDDNTIIAKELLPTFETDRAAWRAVRFMHAWPRLPATQLSDFLTGWATACPAEYRQAVDSVAMHLMAGA